MSTLNISVPQRTFFHYAFTCPRRVEAPQIDGRLGDWDDSSRLPDLMAVEGLDSFAEARLAWNDDGLFLAFEVRGKRNYKIDPSQPTRGDCVEVWIDTRDVKDAHRANRYCHRFCFLPGGRGKGGKEPIGRQNSIDRAREQAPPCPEEAIRVGLRRLKRSYTLEVALPAEGLNGYQPREFNRLGFTYLIHDAELGVQSWSAGRDLPVTQDPSTWGSIELVAD